MLYAIFRQFKHISGTWWHLTSLDVTWHHWHLNLSPPPAPSAVGLCPERSWYLDLRGDFGQGSAGTLAKASRNFRCALSPCKRTGLTQDWVSHIVTSWTFRSSSQPCWCKSIATRTSVESICLQDSVPPQFFLQRPQNCSLRMTPDVPTIPASRENLMGDCNRGGTLSTRNPPGHVRVLHAKSCARRVPGRGSFSSKSSWRTCSYRSTLKSSTKTQRVSSLFSVPVDSGWKHCYDGQSHHLTPACHASPNSRAHWSWRVNWIHGPVWYEMLRHHSAAALKRVRQPPKAKILESFSGSNTSVSTIRKKPFFQCSNHTLCWEC